jgi:hypothetical protein
VASRKTKTKTKTKTTKKAPAKKAGRKSPPKKAPANKAPANKAPANKARANKPARPAPALGGRRPARSSSSEPAALPLPPPEWLAIEGAGPEKRRYERVRHDLQVRLYAGKEQKSYLEASLRTVDVSLSGMFLRSTFFLPEDIPVRVEFDPPWGTTATVHGRVARTDRDAPEPGFAIEFDRLDSESLKDLVCLFAGEHVERVVRDFLPDHRAGDAATLLWEGIVAWELARLRLKVDPKKR